MFPQGPMNGLERLMLWALAVTVAMLILQGCATTRVLHETECMVLLDRDTITTVGHGCEIHRRSR